MKVITLIMKKMGLDVKYMRMETCISENTIKIKNTEKGHSFGSVYVITQQPNKPIKKFSNMKEHGGEDFLMVKVNIKKLMVYFNRFR